MSPLDLDAAANLILDAARARFGVPVRLVNAYSVALADRDPTYRCVLRDRGGVCLPDGTPVAAVMMAHWLRRRVGLRPGRVRGPSLFRHTLLLSARATGTKPRHFLLGTDESTLARLRGRLEGRYPGLAIAGSHAPAFGPVDDEMKEECWARVSATDATVVWVAIGTPKQDVLATALSERLGIPCIGVGAAFDFEAGTKPEASRLIQMLGMEWAHRLLSEPGRLWGRYTIGLWQFLVALAKYRGRGGA